MLEPKPLTFGGDWTEIELDGVPAIESVLRAFVGRCQECGSAAEDQHEGSVLVNPVVVDGTLYGDSFCVDCIDDDEVEGPAFFLRRCRPTTQRREANEKSGPKDVKRVA